MVEGYEGDCATRFEFTRVGGRSQADVVGIKDVGNYYSHAFEIAAVEVKDGKKCKVRYLSQALGYSAFAHRCYLAMPIHFKEEDGEYAKHMGVGLLEIDREGNKEPKEILSPEIKNPNETMMMWFLERSLKMVRCTICGIIVNRYHGKEARFLGTRTNVFGEEKRPFVCSECDKLLKPSKFG